MTSFVKTFRRAKTLLWTALSIVIIASAVLVGLGKLLMPYSAQYQPRLEAWLSKEFGSPVVLESFSGEWRAFGPRLTVRGMRLPSADDDSGDVLIKEAVIDIKPLNALLPARALYDFRVVGAGFRLVRLADGSLELSGLGVTKKPGGKEPSAVRQIASIGEVLLENSSLQYVDEIRGIHLGFHSIDARLQVHGDRLAAELTATLADEASGPVYGDLEATLVMQLGEGQRPGSASWQVSGQELMLDRLASRLPASEYFPTEGKLTTEIWGSWESGKAHELKGVIDLRDARVANQHMDREVQHLNTRFRLSFTELGEWSLDLADFLFQDHNPALTIQSLSVGRQMPHGIGLWLTADAVPVTKPLDIAHDVFEVIGRPWPKYLPGAGVGTVKDFELSLNEHMKMRSASGHFANAQVSDWRIWPDIEGIDGEFRFGRGHGGFAVTGKGVVVTWPRMFSEPLTTDVPRCDINFAWGEREWQVLIDTCSARNEFVSAHGKMRFKDVKRSEGKPTVDINVHADRLDLSKAGPYWPRALLKERVVDWLGDGLQAGSVETARLLIRGDMDEWPFDRAEGRFEAMARVTGGELFYFPGWPRAEDVEATVSFVGTGMELGGRIGNMAGVLVDHATAQVDDFRSPLLKVEFEANTTVSRVVGFISRSPIQAAIATDLGQFGFAGNAFARGALEIPLRDDAADMSVRGIVSVHEGEFSSDSYHFSLQSIEGDLHYDQLGIHGRDLAALFRGKPVALDFRAGSPAGEAPAPQSPDERLRARLKGEFAPVDLLGEPLLETWAPLKRITGTSEWQADFMVRGEPGDSARELELVLSSDLQGTVLELPKPLDKPAEASWPLNIHIPLGEGSALTTLELTGRASAAVSIDAVAGRADGITVEFGDRPADAPVAGRLAITGEVEDLDLDAWVRMVLRQTQSGKDLAGLRLQPVTLHAGRLIFLDRAFSDVGARFETNGDSLVADFDAEMLRGNINFTLSNSGTHNLSAEFERLALDKPLSSGLDMDVDPTTLPNLHLYAKSFRYAGIELGETRIEAYPKGDGFHFETVDAKSPNMSVRASGSWSLRDGTHRSEFDIHMASESLGDFLRHLDFASPVEGGQTLVEFGVWWDGSPGQFGLARLNGDVDFSVNSGVITDAKPGTGRLLGLLSVQSLPRRLALDFRDVFDSGFAFDEANGTFQMRNGSASTDDVVLTSSAANISLSGTTDLVARRYDQVITVRPGLGNTLPVIGAIAGGPGGAAAGLALQGLLHEQLGEASQVQYTITGAWDEPQIEPVLKTRTDGP